MSEKSLSFFCLSLMVSSSWTYSMDSCHMFNRSCTAQFLAKVFSENCLDHWTPIHWWQSPKHTMLLLPNQSCPLRYRKLLCHGLFKSPFQQGGVQGVQVNPPFFKLIIFIAWLFSMQIVTAIQDTYLKFKFSLNIQKLRSI